MAPSLVLAPNGAVKSPQVRERCAVHTPKAVDRLTYLDRCYGNTPLRRCQRGPSPLPLRESGAEPRKTIEKGHLEAAFKDQLEAVFKPLVVHPTPLAPAVKPVKRVAPLLKPPALTPVTPMMQVMLKPTPIAPSRQIIPVTTDTALTPVTPVRPVMQPERDVAVTPEPLELPDILGRTTHANDWRTHGTGRKTAGGNGVTALSPATSQSPRLEQASAEVTTFPSCLSAPMRLPANLRLLPRGEGFGTSPRSKSKSTPSRAGVHGGDSPLMVDAFNNGSAWLLGLECCSKAAIVSQAPQDTTRREGERRDDIQNTNRRLSVNRRRNSTDDQTEASPKNFDWHRHFGSFMGSLEAFVIHGDDNAAAPSSAAATKLEEHDDAMQANKAVHEYNLALHEVVEFQKDFLQMDNKRTGMITREQFDQYLRTRANLDNEHIIPPHLCLGALGSDMARVTHVTWDAFMRWVVSTYWTEEMTLPSLKERKLRRLARAHNMALLDAEDAKRLFDEYDTDASGHVEEDEFRLIYYRVMSVKDPKDVSANRLQRYWREIDIDGSGYVCFPEFLVWYKNTMLKPDLNAC